MVQLRLYLQEISNFLKTVTIKDTMLADSMLLTGVTDEYKELMALNIKEHPYYRNLLGSYIVFTHSEQLRKTVKDLYDHNLLFKEGVKGSVDQVLNTLFPLTTKIRYYDTLGYLRVKEVPNKDIYCFENEIPIVSSYDYQYKIPFAREFLYETKIGNELGLRVHDSTSVVYRIPNDRYNTLIKRCQSSSNIIHSIVYPIAYDDYERLNLSSATINSSMVFENRLQKILDAEDMSLLTYDLNVFEEQEQQSMLDCMAHVLNMIRRRYNVTELVYENLYAPAHYYILWQVLYLALFVQRIQNIHTGDAHSYHIWNYLKSHGFDDCRDILSITQQKFLYKNLPYLLQHKGTQHTFEILDYVLFQHQNILLTGKNILQATEDEETKTVDTTKKYPEIDSIMIAKPVLDHIAEMKQKNAPFEDILHYLGLNAGNTVYNDKQEYTRGKIESIFETYDKERAAGLEYQEDSKFERSTAKQTELLSYVPTSHMNTKLLEVNSNKTIDFMEAIYTKFVGETLLYRLSKNQLNFVISLQLPDSVKSIDLPAKDWIGLIFYAIDRASENTDMKSDCTEKKCNHNRPPSCVYLNWPYTIDGDFEIQETFIWKGDYEYTSKFYLSKIPKILTIGEKTYSLAIDAQDVEDKMRYWIGDNQKIRFNEKKKAWYIVDKDENVILKSSRVQSASTPMTKLVWYSPNGSLTDNRVTIVEYDYIVNLYMKQHPGAIHSVEECRSMLHDQALGFLYMYLDVNHDESAIHRALYHAILRKRCIGEEEVHPIQLNLFDGMTYEEYINQEIPDVENLKLSLIRYDQADDVSAMYARMADTIIGAFLPKNDPYLALSGKTWEYRYNRLVELFKNMTAYNLAYIDMHYHDVDSTKLSIDVSDVAFSRVKMYIDDNSFDNEISFNTYSKIKYKLDMDYPDQMHSLDITMRFDEDPATDAAMKQVVVDNIDKIIDILTDDTISESRKTAKLNILLGSDVGKYVQRLTFEQLQNIQNAVHVISDDHVPVRVRDKFADQAELIDTMIHEETNAAGYDVCPTCGQYVSDGTVVYNRNLTTST